jgi:putative transposase
MADRRSFNTNQGGQFTSDALTDILLANGTALSIDGEGAWRDNVFVERFWRTVKYEEVYLESVAEARSSTGRYLEFFNGRRVHSALDRHTCDQAYYASLPLCMAA